jgi:hypothetical protein
MAVDDQGYAIRFNGVSWSKPTPLHIQAMTTVSCPSATFCVGGDVNGAVLVFRGGSWSRQKKLDPGSSGFLDLFGISGITTVSCPNSSFCMSGDVRGKVSTFDGNRWTHSRPLEPRTLYRNDTIAGAPAVVGVSCPNASFCGAATVAGRVLIWNGASWSEPDLLTPNENLALQELVNLPVITGISCASPTFCVAVTSSGDSYNYNGRTWSKLYPIDPSSAVTGNRDGLTAVSCPSRLFCVAVDDLGRALTFNGSLWSPPRLVDPTLGLNAVSCPNRGFCMALNDLGQALAYDGKSWSPPQTIDG